MPLRLLIQLAFRNLVSNRLNLLIGATLAGTALLLVVGGAIIEAVDTSVSRGVADTLSGDLQVYSAASKDELNIFIVLEKLETDLAPIPDFQTLSRQLKTVENVKAVVPMGTGLARVSGETALDIALHRLRQAAKARAGQGGPPPTDEEYQRLQRHVRQISTVLQGYLQQAQLLSDQARAEHLRHLQEVNTDAFWTRFSEQPFDTLEFLENRIAPLLSEGEPLDLGYLGTDPDAFREAFPRLEVVEGQYIPSGRRGLMLAKYFYEESLKLRSARRLDKLKAARERGATIAEDPQLELWVKENQNQLREIVLQLDDVNTQRAVQLLQAELGSTEADLATLLRSFFATTDQNFDARYRFFYERLAPMLELYRVRIGEPLTVRSYTKRGTVQSLNLVVYGTYQYAGLANSDLIGNLNLMDILSFRELYGLASTADLAEQDALRAQVGLRELKSEEIEGALFSGEPQAKRTVATSFDDGELFAQMKEDAPQADAPTVFPREAFQSGLVFHAAVLLKDPSVRDQTMEAIRALSQREGLGLKVATWQEASGLMGALAVLVGLVLFVAVAIIFLVTLVVINNAVMMATLRRGQEIGTLRAIGSQRSLILAMFVVESAVLAAVAGGAGSLLGAGVVLLLQAVGIPAVDDATNFLFAGPRLHPPLSVDHLLVACAVVMFIGVGSTLLPARFALKISPLRAMQTED